MQDVASGTVYWSANSVDEAGRITQESLVREDRREAAPAIDCPYLMGADGGTVQVFDLAVLADQYR